MTLSAMTTIRHHFCPVESFDLQNLIKISKCATIFYGREGISERWQGLEVSTIVNEYAERGLRVIVVILREVEGELNLPLFIKNFQIVDYRKISPDPLDELMRGVIP
jgi:hypothetical protein